MEYFTLEACDEEGKLRDSMSRESRFWVEK